VDLPQDQIFSKKKEIQVSPTRAKCPAHLALHFMAVIMFVSAKYEAPPFTIFVRLYTNVHSELAYRPTNKNASNALTFGAPYT
jgi:hypothetical protein